MCVYIYIYLHAPEDAERRGGGREDDVVGRVGGDERGGDRLQVRDEDRLGLARHLGVTLRERDVLVHVERVRLAARARGWPLQDIRLLQSYCVRANHPCLAPPRLHCSHYYNTIARPLRNIRSPHNPPFVCHILQHPFCMPYTIHNWYRQYPVKANAGANQRPSRAGALAPPEGRARRGQVHGSRCDLAFARDCHHQYCMVYGIHREGRWRGVYCAMGVQ